MNLRSTLGMAAAAVLALGAATAGNATLMNCTGDFAVIAGKVASNSGCQVSTEPNDVPQPGLVNSEEFFGFDDWLFDGKFPESPGTLVDFTTGVGGDGAGQSGTWSVDSGFWDIYSEVMLIFKNGDMTTLVGYLLTSADGLSGTWASPFTNPPFQTTGGTKDVSHISTYYREGTSEVPEPGSLFLLDRVSW